MDRRVQEALRVPDLGNVGRYQLEEEVACGGQGVVYRAFDPITRRTVALKRLRAGLFASPSMRARLRREIELIGTLDHPNVVTVYDAEVLEGQWVVALQWIDGVPITDWCWRGDTPRPIRETLAVFLDVCSAVQHAHGRGVLHRDLKPSNLLVDGQGRPNVLDFGLAHRDQAEAADAAQRLTRGPVGTVEYAAPEQLRDANSTDIRSDVYSLSVVLYEMLTGRLPVSATVAGEPGWRPSCIRNRRRPRPGERCRGNWT